MGPNFCYTIENISFWGCRKQEMVQSGRRMTSFLLNLRSGVLLIHGEERVQTSSKQLILIWDSISSSKVHYHININRFNMHIVDKYMKNRYFAAVKGYCSKKYLSVPLWDTSVTNSWGMAYIIWLLFFSNLFLAVGSFMTPGNNSHASVNVFFTYIWKIIKTVLKC